MIKVLVVDDDFMVAKIHSGFVEQTPGFTVAGVAHSGAEALAAIRDLSPDLVLLDIYLPDRNGIEVLRQLQRDTPDLDVIVVTAAREAKTVRHALRGGAVHYLMKPFCYDDLRKRLEHYASTHHALAQAHAAEQADVDRMFGLPADRTTQPPPKGLSAETLTLVERALRDAPGDLSASQCAELIGISRVSARRYLEHLTGLGKVDVRLRYGSAGRPERRYTRKA